MMVGVTSSAYSGLAMEFSVKEATMTTTDQATIVDQVHGHRTWFIVLGVLLMLAGAFAMAFPLAGSLAV